METVCTAAAIFESRHAIASTPQSMTGLGLEKKVGSYNTIFFCFRTLCTWIRYQIRFTYLHLYAKTIMWGYTY